MRFSELGAGSVGFGEEVVGVCARVVVAVGGEEGVFCCDAGEGDCGDGGEEEEE